MLRDLSPSTLFVVVSKILLTGEAPSKVLTDLLDSQHEVVHIERIVLDRMSQSEITNLFSVLAHWKVKQLCFGACVVKCNSPKEMEGLLQLLVPESPKAIELNQKLKNEITQEKRNTSHSWEIDKLEKNIKNEIELKYNTMGG